MWILSVLVQIFSQDEKDTDGEVSNELALDNVGGVFIVLWIGVGIAFLLAFVEFLWNVQQVAVEEHVKEKLF